MIHLFRGVQIAELDVQVVNVSPPIEVAEVVTHTHTHTQGSRRMRDLSICIKYDIFQKRLRKLGIGPGDAVPRWKQGFSQDQSSS